MNQYNEELHDPKGQGQPPPYTHHDPPQVHSRDAPMQMGQPTHVQMGQPMQMQMGQPMQMQMGQPMQIQMGQPMQMQMGLPMQMHTGQPMQMHIGQPMQMHIGQPTHVTMGQPLGVMYQSHVNSVAIPMVVGRQLSSHPTPITCVSCKEHIITRVEIKSTTKTHLIAALLCILGCWPCVFIPYCSDSCRNADHYCPNCSAYIGSCTN